MTDGIQASPTESHQTGEERNSEFQQQLAALRQQNNSPFAENFFEAAVNIAASIFRTPDEFAQYAIPYFITTDDYHGSDERRILGLLERWNLTNRPQTVIAVMDYMAKRNSWTESRFVQKYGALAKQYLPADKQRVVFDRLIQGRVYIPRENTTTRMGEFWANTVKDFVPQDEWLSAYTILKQRLVDKVKQKGRRGNTDITDDKIERVAETLARFGATLPLNSHRKSEVLNDVATLLLRPEEVYPDQEIKEQKYRYSPSRKAVILYEAKRDLDPSRLSPADYEAMVSYADDNHNEAKISEKIELLKECAEKCLPEEGRNQRLVTDFLYLLGRRLEKVEAYQIPSIEEDATSVLKTLPLTNDQKLLYKSAIEYAVQRIVENGGKAPNDNSLYNSYARIADILPIELRLEWFDEMTGDEFLNPNPKKNGHVKPFADFLVGEFDKATAEDRSEIISSDNVAACRINSNLVLVFSASTVKPAEIDVKQGEPDAPWWKRIVSALKSKPAKPQPESMAYLGGEFMLASKALKQLTESTSYPQLSQIIDDRFNEMMARLG